MAGPVMDSIRSDVTGSNSIMHHLLYSSLNLAQVRYNPELCSGESTLQI